MIRKTVLCCLSFLFLSCAHTGTVKIVSGQSFPGRGLSFDISYDTALDQIVPGYKVVSVGIKNTDMDPFLFLLETDRWMVVDRDGHRWAATIDLKNVDPNVWDALSPEMQGALAFLLVIPEGVSQVVDLFVKQNADLGNLQGVFFHSTFLKKKILISRR